MNILRAAVIMASTSREKSSNDSLSMPSSQTRGMLAACFMVVVAHIQVEREFGEQNRMERSEDAVPVLADTWKYADIVIKTLRSYLERLKINERALVKDFTVVYFQSSLTNAFVLIKCPFLSIIKTKTFIIPINLSPTEASMSYIYSAG